MAEHPCRASAAGVERIVLAAGERDGARGSMRSLAESTAWAGLPTRFMSLGPVGHEFPSDMAARMCLAIAWVRGSGGPLGGNAPE